jgi:hypothetical protein
LFVLALLLPAFGTAGNDRVANFSFGEHGTKRYEHFSFWIHENSKTEIIYTYGIHRKKMKLRPLKTAHPERASSFKVRFPEGYVLVITPKESTLLVAQSSGRHAKTFQWAYEGPVNGVGAACPACVDQAEAAKFVKDNFLK